MRKTFYIFIILWCFSLYFSCLGFSEVPEKSLFIWLHQVLVVAHKIFVATCGIFNCGMWDLVSWPRMEPSTPAFIASSLNHWTIRKVPQIEFLDVCILSSFSSNTCWEYCLPQLLHHGCTWKFLDFCFSSEYFLLYNLCILFMLLVLCGFYFLHIAYPGCWPCIRAMCSV